MTDFTVAEGASPDDPECALECWECGKVMDKVVEEIDPKTRLPYATPRVRPAISRAERERARAEMRAEFRAHVERGGARRENFTKGRRLTDG